MTYLDRGSAVKARVLPAGMVYVRCSGTTKAGDDCPREGVAPEGVDWRCRWHK